MATVVCWLGVQAHTGQAHAGQAHAGQAHAVQAHAGQAHAVQGHAVQGQTFDHTHDLTERRGVELTQFAAATRRTTDGAPIERL